MATKKATSTKKRPPKKKYAGNGGGGKGGGGDGGYSGDGDEPLGEAVENLDIHEAYLKYRLEGGDGPSSQGYARAVKQFQQLPGAIRGKPPFVPPDSLDDDDVGSGKGDRNSGKGDKP